MKNINVEEKMKSILSLNNLQIKIIKEFTNNLLEKNEIIKQNFKFWPLLLDYISTTFFDIPYEIFKIQIEKNLEKGDFSSFLSFWNVFYKKLKEELEIIIPYYNSYWEEAKEDKWHFTRYDYISDRGIFNNIEDKIYFFNYYIYKKEKEAFKELLDILNICIKIVNTASKYVLLEWHEDFNDNNKGFYINTKYKNIIDLSLNKINLYKLVKTFFDTQNTDKKLKIILPFIENVFNELEIKKLGFFDKEYLLIMKNRINFIKQFNSNFDNKVNDYKHNFNLKTQKEKNKYLEEILMFLVILNFYTK